MAASRRSLAAIALLAACMAAAAQERGQLPIQLTAAGGLRYDSQNGVVEYSGVTITQGDIRITADRATTKGVDFEDSRWQFSGNVRMTMPESALASDTAEVRFAGGEIQSASVTGAPATFEQRREGDLAQGRANRIDYDLKRGTIELAGGAWVTDGKTEITGETLVYSTTNQRVVSQKEVVITIQPEKKPQDPPKPPQ